ncbi:MAG: metal-dependent hydrolase, partial [Elusimicrobiota bacterium]
MDPLTHTLVGVGIANAFYREKLGPRAVPLLALAANLPDIDVAVHLTGQASAVLLRRGFGHSLLLAPLWCAGFAFLMSRWRWKDKGFSELFAPSLVGVASHLLFDLALDRGDLLEAHRHPHDGNLVEVGPLVPGEGRDVGVHV